jgi:hypothetical protein
MERRLAELTTALSSGDVVYRERDDAWEVVGTVVPTTAVVGGTDDDPWLFVGTSEVGRLGDVVHDGRRARFAIRTTTAAAEDDLLDAVRAAIAGGLPAPRETCAVSLPASMLGRGLDLLSDPAPDDLWVIRQTCPGHGVPEPCPFPPPHMSA